MTLPHGVGLKDFQPPTKEKRGTLYKLRLNISPMALKALISGNGAYNNCSLNPKTP